MVCWAQRSPVVEEGEAARSFSPVAVDAGERTLPCYERLYLLPTRQVGDFCPNSWSPLPGRAVP